MSRFKPASLWLAAATPVFALAQPVPPAPAGAPTTDAAALRALRQEIDALKSAYEARLQALEQRLQQAEATAAPAPAPTAPAAPPAPAVAAAPEPLPAPAPVAGNGNAFNPAVSLILSGQYQRSTRDPAGYAIGRFPLPADAEVGPGNRGFSLGETELAFSANVDPFWRGAATIALADGEASVEEAFVQTTSLGNGLAVKAGRFFSSVGYLNSQHAHVWDFVDAPLAYQALLGGQYGDDGVQLTWLAPTDQYLQFGLEMGRGRGFPGSDTPRNGLGMAALSVHTGGDIGASHSWRAGVSVLNARPVDVALVDTNPAGQPIDTAFTGRSRVWVADGVWKWAPEGNATRTSFKLQGEVLLDQRRGTLVVDPAGLASSDTYRANRSGWYLQGIYQFLPRWRAGLRTERLSPGTPAAGVNDTLLSTAAFTPRKDTLLLDFQPSEFSRVRLQFADDRARLGGSDRQWTVQYQMSLGAHGAHTY